MENCEAMTSSTHSFAYSYRLVKKCFLKNFETSKCHNFLIFEPIFIRFSVFCSKIFTLSSEIKLNLVWISSLRFKSTQHSWLHALLWTVLSYHVDHIPCIVLFLYTTTSHLPLYTPPFGPHDPLPKPFASLAQYLDNSVPRYLITSILQ